MSISIFAYIHTCTEREREREIDIEILPKGCQCLRTRILGSNHSSNKQERITIFFFCILIERPRRWNGAKVEAASRESKAMSERTKKREKKKMITVKAGEGRGAIPPATTETNRKKKKQTNTKKQREIERRHSRNTIFFFLLHQSKPPRTRQLRFASRPRNKNKTNQKKKVDTTAAKIEVKSQNKPYKREKGDKSKNQLSKETFFTQWTRMTRNYTNSHHK